MTVFLVVLVPIVALLAWGIGFPLRTFAFPCEHSPRAFRAGPVIRSGSRPARPLGKD